MLEVEALQLLQRDEQLEQTIADPDLPAEQIPEKEIKDFLEAAIASERASAHLEAILAGSLYKRFGASSPDAGPGARGLVSG